MCAAGAPVRRTKICGEKKKEKEAAVDREVDR
jgi:hypothetical protein